MDFSSKSTSELKETLRMLKIVAYSLTTIVFLLLAITIYGLLFKENSKTFLALLVVGLSCSAILPLQFSSLKKIKDEIKSREQ
ncbi:hypothetical protein [Polaribacter porphyrae]|uniref:Uncharacterized protein n=1 Tax=Polaribacter porphyrae TaxID=1137780 RepID=A0A2S7WSQ8_9FLAO|nr:hypothetical protein [Polaribacter porphyrae]PQJ80352.1 hypothetical protein BTO18_14730 [Polaribacter porphyrae]